MKRYVSVTVIVAVEVDESKFTDEFLREFRGYMYPFHSVDDHMIHLAELEAQGQLDCSFIEGYGPAKDMGISAEVLEVESEIDHE